MKKFALTLIMIASFAVTAYSQVTLEVTNKTSEELFGLYTSGTEGDLLPNSTLKVNSFATITYPEGYDCEVTVTISYDNDGEEEVAFEFDIDICESSTLEVFDEYYVLDGEKYSYDS